jgi:translation initiation factor 2 alpha subunit (eIF-2alpha)
MDLMEMFNKATQQALEQMKNLAGTCSVYALNRKKQRIELVLHKVTKEEADKVVGEFPLDNPALSIVHGKRPDPEGFYHRLVLFLVEEYGIVGAECSQLINEFNNRAIEYLLKPEPTFRG